MSIERVNRIVKESMPVLFAILSAAWLAQFFLAPFSGSISDFPQYYAPVRLICTGHGADSYKFPIASAMQKESFPTMGERAVPTYLPPPSMFWFLPFGLMSGSQAFIVWKIVQIVSLVGSIFLLRDAWGLNRKAVCYLIAGICASGPAFAATQLGQISMLILCALSTMIWAFKKDKLWVAAIALSVLMLKPQEGLPIMVFLAGAKRYKMLGMTVGVLTVQFLVIFCLIGVQGMTEYFATTSNIDTSQSILMQSELGPTVRGQLLRLLPDSKSLITQISGIIMLISWALIFFSGRKFASSPAWLGAGLLIAVPIGVLTCLHLHSYDLLLLVPSLVLVLSGPLESIAPAWLLVGGFLLTGTFMVPFYIYIHWDHLLKEHWILNPHFFALLTMTVGFSYLAYRYPEKIQAPVKPTVEQIS